MRRELVLLSHVYSSKLERCNKFTDKFDYVGYGLEVPPSAV